MKATRAKVYAAIDSERDYQDARWGSTESKGLHSISEFIAYCDDYLLEAKHILARKPMVAAYPEALPIIRKVAAMLVSCMEQHGAVLRRTEGKDPQQTTTTNLKTAVDVSPVDTDPVIWER